MLFLNATSGEAPEEPAHIIRKCDVFWQERLDVFNCLVWLPDKEWTVDQMLRFLDKDQVKALEEEAEEN